MPADRAFRDDKCAAVAKKRRDGGFDYNETLNERDFLTEKERIERFLGCGILQGDLL